MTTPPATSIASPSDAASEHAAGSSSATKTATTIAPQHLTSIAAMPVAANAASTSSPVTPSSAASITSKEWVIPPRPKPGRKPATDTPPTKRKAQNRAAQRAFRERRAARVGELEELLEHQRREQDEKDQTGHERVHALELELQTFKSQCAMLQNMLEKERQEAVKVLAELQTLRQMHQPVGDMSSSNIQTKLHTRKEQNSHTPGRQPLQISQIMSPLSNSPPLEPANDRCGSCQGPNGPCACADAIVDVMNATCGRCGPGSSSCECFEAVVNAQPPPPPQDHKRRLSSPPSHTEEKRLKPNTNTSLENDYTTRRPRDPCGFCYGSNFCACENAQLATYETGDSFIRTSSATTNQQMHTPPPCDTDPAPIPMEITLTGAVKLPKLCRTPSEVSAPSFGRCGPNGPGTCQQCKLDPRSGNFCRALAAKAETERGGVGERNGSNGGCCGGRSPGEGCCKSEAPSGGSGPSGGLTVSCAEAYRKLSSHEAFGEAAEDIGSWLPKLRAAPAAQPLEPRNASAAPKSGSRHPLEVEAASVMSVLKEFDVRFGRDR